jgi:uncharacterized protein (TIGR03435 family)
MHDSDPIDVLLLGGSSMKTVLIRMGFLALVANSAFGQAAAPRPAFSVASVKIYQPAAPFKAESQGFSMSPDGIRATHVTLRGCLQWAYQIVEISWPGWITSESYDIVAKADGPVPADELQQMLQTLLEDRFKLTLRRETRRLPIGVLAVGKNGTRNLAPVEGNEPMEIKREDGKVKLKNAPMSGVASVLASPFGNMPLERVVNETELGGRYNITLDLRESNPRDPIFAGDYQGMRDELLSFVSAALEKQYGLQLERRVAPVETLAVEGGNKEPSEN